MSDAHFAHWPRHQSHHLTLPETDLFYNLEVAARRYPGKPFMVFYDTKIAYARLKDEAERLAGWLAHNGVGKGDRVLLFMQNSPQFAIGYYAILRANAVVVPLNPMNLTSELRHYVSDSGARVALVAQEILPQMRPLLAEGLSHIVVTAYSDYLEEQTDLVVPEIVRAPRQTIGGPGVTLWSDALAQDLRPGPVNVGPDDLCVLPYTSGTTGKPKGCMHSHRSVMHPLVANAHWAGLRQDSVGLAVLPLFHVTGMQSSLNTTIYVGGTVVLLSRWDREAAAKCIERYRISSWTAIPTMVIDFLNQPDLDRFDLSSLSRMAGGGAAMPEAVAQHLLDRGITYIEGYGMSETIAATHLNPPDRPKKQCLGIPIYGTESRVVDPLDFHELPAGEVGEIVTCGPQVMQGYWNNDAATQDAFVEIEGRRWLRTGDLGRVDEDGYFFMVDRLKRMINASGYKVWPAEVESLMYGHPAVQEACVIAARDAHRGETVKAVVVLKAGYRDRVSEQDVASWSRENMAAYKAPRIVQFVDSLPKSATGKVMWRALQEQELSARP